ncbi:MAG TPA: DEAD/DEAH box helicase family protein [Acidimicrobiia bacterium]|jgi:hypothetical protein
MRYELMDYQRDGALGVLERLDNGRALWNSSHLTSAFALSAITGAGKTVIASAVVEATFFGSSDLDADPDARTAFLWITDDPALNRQTRTKMLDSSDLLSARHLVELDDGFLERELAPGHVYFLNTQKLSKSSNLTKSNNNLRQLSFWEVLANTVGGDTTDLVMILDEAHRGMKRVPDRATIVQRLINGEHGSNPPVPLVWGISATIDRFVKAMGETPNRTSLPHVAVDIDRVRLSGLVKDEIGLDQPDEKGTFSTTLLREAVQSTLEYEHRWAVYSQTENEPPVLPVLVIQVPDKADAQKLGEIVQVVEHEWPALGADAVAHVFGEHEPIVLGSRTIEWVQPERIQTETQIRVVLAKEAISTGWDCPRAEVLYSERPAKDATHIAQVIGRMVRQPLAHRIATDDALNSVSCYLPLFDRDALTAIKSELEGTGKGNGQVAVGAEVVRMPQVFGRNPKLEPAVFELVGKLPSIPTPDKSANPLRRAKRLVQLLADDAGGIALLPGADAQLTERLNKRMDGLAAEFSTEVAEQVEDLRTLVLHRERVTPSGVGAGESTRVIDTHAKDLDRDSTAIIRSLKEGVGLGYYKYRAALADVAQSKLDVRIEVAALLRVPRVVDRIEDAATEFVHEQLSAFAAEIANTTGDVRDKYRKVQEQTSKPEALTIELRDNEKAATSDREGNALPRFSGHLFADADGMYPTKLNDWETEVVAIELARPSFVAWYRNPSRATPNSLRIAYETDAGAWTSLQVDFVVVSKRDDGSLGASIVDPHGDYLADAKAKLLALAQFAEDRGDEFVRIWSIGAGSDGSLRFLDLQEPAVRDEVRAFAGGKVTALYEGAAAMDLQ